jgi:hypothetical protein
VKLTCISIYCRGWLRMRGAIPPLLQYIFMACYLVKHRDNFIVIYTLQTYIHTYIIHTYINGHKYTHMHTYTKIHTYIHTYAHTRIHIHRNIHTYIHTYIHNTYLLTYLLTQRHVSAFTYTVYICSGFMHVLCDVSEAERNSFNGSSESHVPGRLIGARI